jgi:hypothetical protein
MPIADELVSHGTAPIPVASAVTSFALLVAVTSVIGVRSPHD